MEKLAAQNRFGAIVNLIKASRSRAFQSVNHELVDLYLQIGEYVAKRIESEGCWKSVLNELADFIRQTESTPKGFSSQSLWRMRQFYDTYKDSLTLSALVGEIGWTNNLIVLTRCKNDDEKEFYLRLFAKENYSSRELERQIDAGVFERTMLGNKDSRQC